MLRFQLENEDIRNHVEAFPDLQTFLSCLEEHWSDVNEAFIARAPGRLDVMGGISDYSGGLVLQLPIKEACFAAVCFQSSLRLEITSIRQSGLISKWECSIASFNQIQSYDECRQFFESNDWVRYIAGCLVVLKLEGYLTKPLPGIRILLSSAVPEGTGVASSASIEVATMTASIAALKLDIPHLSIAELCQRAENRVVGASCGIMDQMTAVMGQKNALMKLLCQPCELLGHLPILPHLMIIGIDSGDRHSIGESSYTSVRIGAFMGLKILKSDAHYSSAYLAQMSVEALEATMHLLPDVMNGQDFRDQYGDHDDPETDIDVHQDYAIKQPTQHPILEIQRVTEFCQLLDQSSSCDGVKLGRLMQASHEAYTQLKLDAPGTTQLYQLSCHRIEEGIYGGRISGGGSGGTVCLLLSSDHPEAIDKLRSAYQSFRGTIHLPIVFMGSSDGACRFGIVHLKTGKLGLFKG